VAITGFRKIAALKLLFREEEKLWRV